VGKAQSSARASSLTGRRQLSSRAGARDLRGFAACECLPIGVRGVSYHRAMATKGVAREYLVPMYSQSNVAQIVRAAPSTINRWAIGDSSHPPLITVTSSGQGLTVPFVGLAEAFVLNAFRKAGLPMQRIRPAVEILKHGMGVEHALANNLLLTDGSEILYRDGDDLDRRLVVLRSGQAVFNEVVTDYLKSIDFANSGYAKALRLPQYPSLDVRVDPTINGGRPTLAGRGIAIDDVLGRIRAGEEPSSVAYDYDLDRDDVMMLNRIAA